MRHISFAYTTPCLLIGRSPDPEERRLAKTVTRRDWSADYANSFSQGEMLWAADRDFRYGGKKVATIRLTCRPYLESTADMPDSDYRGEGFQFLSQHPELLPKTLWGQKVSADDFTWEGFCRWRRRSVMLYVVRFALVSVQPGVRVSYLRKGALL